MPTHTSRVCLCTCVLRGDIMSIQCGVVMGSCAQISMAATASSACCMWPHKAHSVGHKRHLVVSICLTELFAERLSCSSMIMPPPHQQQLLCLQPSQLGSCCLSGATCITNQAVSFTLVGLPQLEGVQKCDVHLCICVTLAPGLFEPLVTNPDGCGSCCVTAAVGATTPSVGLVGNNA
jgi:hypothetical protein